MAPTMVDLDVTAQNLRPSIPTDFDVFIVGSGGAGVAAAIQAVSMGGKVAIAEGGIIGGTCVNIGCIPSKNLIEAAAHYHAVQSGYPGIEACTPQLNWKQVMQSKDDLVTRLRQDKYEDVLASYPGLAVLRGRVRLTGGGNGAPVTIGACDGPNAKTYTAKKVIIATGARPGVPSVPGADSISGLDSTTAMELSELPESMLVLGGGSVGLELGQTFARFGTRVTIVEIAPRLLPLEDEAVSSALEEFLRAEGLEIHTGVTPVSIERQADEVILHVRQGTLDGTLTAKHILFATGRRPNTDDVGLENVGVKVTDRGFVQVDSAMRTSNDDIFAAGDVTGGPGYVYVAAAGGRVAAENAMMSRASLNSSVDDPRELDLSAVPGVTFTSPQVASVGLSELKARELGFNVRTSTVEIGQLPRGMVSGDTRGFVKMVADANSGRLLGVHAVAALAGELMGEATIAIRFGLTARDLSGTLHPYLTWGEALKLAAQGFEMDLSKLSCCA